ncbi:hypothetical protein Syun_004547 [Stephania yunnanensis]|uniref:VQ domain-containing protein n=1 Tax=Stephania yunnanensis TaxID=152371 RepID=A0AAP0Q1J1_9MAGN
MDPYSSSSTSSFDSSSFSYTDIQLRSTNTFGAPKNVHKIKKGIPVETFLHSVRSNQYLTNKPWRKPIPPPPRVYRVHPTDFRDLVQKLTGKPKFPATQRLQSAAPPPLETSTMTLLPWTSISQQSVASDHNNGVVSEAASEIFVSSSSSAMSNGAIDVASFAMAPSPTSWCTNWCSSTPFLMSPGTLASLEQGRVL